MLRRILPELLGAKVIYLVKGCPTDAFANLFVNGCFYDNAHCFPFLLWILGSGPVCISGDRRQGGDSGGERPQRIINKVVMASSAERDSTRVRKDRSAPWPDRRGSYLGHPSQPRPARR